MMRCIALLTTIAVLAPAVPSNALQRSALSSSVVRAIPADGGTLRFGSVAGVAVSVMLPSNDASSRTRVLLRGWRDAPNDAPKELRTALGAVPGSARTLVWLEATARDDVHFDPGDVGFAIRTRGIALHDDLVYFALACDRANCKPRAIGPIFRDGDTLEMTNAHTPFHFHFATERSHDYIGIVYARLCPGEVCPQ